MDIYSRFYLGGFLNQSKQKSLKKLSCAVSVGFTLFANTSIAGVPDFLDITQQAGITSESTTNPNVDTGGGVAWIDIDNDGFQDIYIPNPELGASWLYKNNGDGAFTEMALAAGADNSVYRSTGAAIGDVNGDGCDDIFVTNGANSVSEPFDAAQQNTLLLNDFCSTGVIGFSDITSSAGLDGEVLNSMVSSFGDIDNDGDLDLYVGNYLPDGNMAASPVACDANQLYINNGAAQFTEIGVAAGIDNSGCTLGTVMSDFDDDGDLDIYVTNDFTTATGGSFVVDVPDAFYRNLGVVGGMPAFELATDTMLADAPNGMGIAVGDYDSDGDLDYYVTSFSGSSGAVQNILNRNNGNGTFTNVADEVDASDRGGYFLLESDGSLGAQVPSTIGWGAVFVDIDNDGYQDLYKSNGRIQGVFGEAIFEIQPNALMMNNRDGTFTRQGFVGGGFSGHTLDGETDTAFCPFHPGTSKCFQQGRGLATADFDNDGDVDIFYVSSGQTGSQAPRLYKNTLNDDAKGKNWLQLRLQGTSSNNRGIGAKVRVTSGSNTNVQLQEMGSGSSHGSTNSLVLHYGLDTAYYASQVVVEWPSGCVQVLSDLAGGVHTIIEDCSAPHVIAGRVTYQGKGIADFELWDVIKFPNSVKTDKTGHYVITDITDNYNTFLNAFAAREGFSASPGSAIVSVESSDISGVDFVATAKPGTVIGTIQTSSGVGIADMNVWDVFTFPTQTRTDTNGLFVLTGFEAGDNVYLNPNGRSGLTRSPDDVKNTSPYVHDGAASENNNYTATLKDNTVSGFFFSDTGKGLQRMTIWDIFEYPDSSVTDVNGFYIIADMADNTYSFLNPVGGNSGYTVSPGSAIFLRSEGPDENHNFVAVPK